MCSSLLVVSGPVEDAKARHAMNLKIMSQPQAGLWRRQASSWQGVAVLREVMRKSPPSKYGWSGDLEATVVGLGKTQREAEEPLPTNGA